MIYTNLTNNDKAENHEEGCNFGARNVFNLMIIRNQMMNI